MAASEVIPANDVQYSELCKVLESISKKKKHRQEQDKILATFINEFRINVAKVGGKKNSSFFPILRLLLPDKERDRPAYNLKSNTLGKQLVKILSLKETSDDAKKLLNFRSVTNSDDNDFAGVAYFVFKSRIGKNSGTLNVGKINDILDKIANAEVGNKGPIYDEAFSYALRTLNAEQMKWFLRIILKDLKLGMGTNRILAAFHPDAPELLNSCGNLSKVCEELEDGDTRPLEMGIKVFFAVSPMLSERLDVTNIMNLPDRVYQIENKFDGERFQMHIDNNTFEYFSRKGYPYSDTYGKTYDAGLLTPLLKECFSASVHSCILDGEMMGWHKQRQCFGSKGMAFDVKKITERSAFRPCYCAFDVLYYNGKSLVGPADKGGLPLYKRLEILKTMFKDVPGVIMHSKCTTVQNRTDILEALNKAIDDEEEGIVVKDTESYYIVSRRNAGWYKVKPEYTENTMEDLDLVVIGADEAENKQQGRARSFHVACADVVNTGDTPHRWVCVGKVATGLTFEEKEKVCAKLEKHWTLRKTTPPPPNLVFNKDKPDFWIKPEDSVVFQVRATELIRSTDFGTSHTLRFPRIVAVREDKPVNDVQTLNDFNKLVEEKGSVIKLSNKRISQDQIEAAEAKTRKKRVAKVIKVAEQFRTKVGEVAVTSQALAGRKLHILSDDEDCTKADLVRIIESHGGKHVENIGRDTWCCVVGRPKFRTRTLIQSQELDIITTAWLRALPSSNKPCTLSPLDMLSIKKSTKLALSKDYDRFGDSYTENIDVDTLKKIFNKMDNEPEIFLTHAEMLKLDKELYGNHNPFSFLRPCFIHFTSNDSLLEIKARMYGATVCDINSPNLTHIVKLNKDILNVNSSNVPIVSGEWLNTCFEREKLVSEHNFWIQ